MPPRPSELIDAVLVVDDARHGGHDDERGAVGRAEADRGVLATPAAGTLRQRRRTRRRNQHASRRHGCRRRGNGIGEPAAEAGDVQSEPDLRRNVGKELAVLRGVGLLRSLGPQHNDADEPDLRR